MTEHDPVNHPQHYASHPSGVEVIEITRHLNFNIGNAVKYICRHNLKGNPVQDIQKAHWYVADEILRTSGSKDAFPIAAAVNLSKYLAVEEYMLANDLDGATLCADTIDALQTLANPSGRLYVAKFALERRLDALA